MKPEFPSCILTDNDINTIYSAAKAALQGSSASASYIAVATPQVAQALIDRLLIAEVELDRLKGQMEESVQRAVAIHGLMLGLEQGANNSIYADAFKKGVLIGMERQNIPKHKTRDQQKEEPGSSVV